jgi:hypothetical protein
MNEQNKRKIMKRIVLLTFMGSLALALTAWGAPKGKHAQPCRRSAWRNTDTLRIAGPHSNALRGSCLSRQILLLPSAATGCPSVFGADMHPEKDAATLNKCKPQKV